LWCDSVDVATAREVVGALLLRHVCQLVSNAHAITGIVRSSSQSTVDCVDSMDHARVLSSGRTFTRDEGSSTAVDVSQQVRLATAIYPTASLMNHSCDPSIISRCQQLHCYIHTHIHSPSQLLLNQLVARTCHVSWLVPIKPSGTLLDNLAAFFKKQIKATWPV